jgi:hypothetical protein
MGTANTWGTIGEADSLGPGRWRVPQSRDMRQPEGHGNGL